MVMELLPALVIPAIVGLFILLKYRHSRYARMLGWFTFKPIIATPFWLFLISLTPPVPIPAGSPVPAEIPMPLPLGLLPGATLTIIFVAAYKDLLKQLGKTGYLLLIMDSIRWINSGLILPYGAGISGYVVALIAPAAFALLALILLYAPGAKANLVQSAAWQSRQRTPWIAGLLWVMLTAGTMAFGNLVGSLVGQAPYFGALAVGTIMGACLGIGQWLVLRKYLLHSQWWIGVTALGAAIGLFAGYVLITWDDRGLHSDPVVRSLIYRLLIALAIGSAQWIVLRQYVKRSSEWLWATAIGWVIPTVGIATTSGYASLFVSWLVRGLIVGLCTALALARIMRNASKPIGEPQTVTPSPLALENSRPAQPDKPGVLSRLAAHTILFPLMLAAAGLIIILLCGILPVANKHGYFDKWQPLTQVPAGTTEIVAVGWDGLTVKTGSGEIFQCKSSAKPEDCALVAQVPIPDPYLKSCAESGPEYSPFTDRPQELVLCIQQIGWHFPGGRTVYAVEQNGAAWRWYHGDTLTDMLMTFWALFVALCVIGAGVIVWYKATSQLIVQPPAEEGSD